MAMIEESHNPERVEKPTQHLSRGRNLVPQRYIVGWPDGVVKVGSTWFGKRRWGIFTAQGAQLLDLANYAELGHSSAAEFWLHQEIRNRYPLAFKSKEDAAGHLGKADGWMECFAVPVEDWPALLELAGA